MDDLRSEIRAAFEREQAGHAPAAAMRRDIGEAVTAQAPRERNFQWLAVVAAAVLGILVVAGLMSTRFAHRPVGQANPQASPVGDYGPPPERVPLLYVWDPNHDGWFIGFDWSGKPRGTVKLASAMPIGMAPDGQSFASGFGAKGGSDELLDRLGRPVPGSGAIPGSTLPMWADDNRHMCGMVFDQQTLGYTLVTVAPGEAVKQVAAIPGTQSADQGGFRINSCSVRNDQAILVRTNTMWPSELWIVRLSDGKVLSRTTYANPELLSNVVASADAALIAENSSKSVGQLMGQTAPSTIIRRLSDRTVVATLDPSVGVLAFSSDDSLVLAATTPWVAGQPTQLAVIDLQSGRTLWTYNSPFSPDVYHQDMFSSAVAQPGGRDFALVLRKPNPDGPLIRLIIVHADGTTSDFPRNYVPTW